MTVNIFANCVTRTSTALTSLRRVNCSLSSIEKISSNGFSQCWEMTKSLSHCWEMTKCIFMFVKIYLARQHLKQTQVNMDVENVSSFASVSIKSKVFFNIRSTLLSNFRLLSWRGIFIFFASEIHIPSFTNVYNVQKTAHHILAQLIMINISVIDLWRSHDFCYPLCDYADEYANRYVNPYCRHNYPDTTSAGVPNWYHI